MLTVTTEYSLGHSLISFDDVKTLVKDNGIETVVLTDTMTVTGMIPLTEKLGETNLITGVRLTLVEDAQQEVAPIYQPKVYPRTERGMQIIYKYLTRSFERPYFYMQPRLDFASFFEMLAEGEGELRVSTGDINSIFNYAKYKDFLFRVQQHSYTFAEVCPLKTARWDRLNFLALTWAEDNEANCLYHIPTLYTKENADVFPIHFSINKNVEFNYLKPYHTDYHYQNLQPFLDSMNDRLYERYGDCPITGTEKLDPKEYYKWESQKPKLPQLSNKPMAALKKLTINGFKDRLFRPVYGYQPERNEVLTTYADRLNYEFDVLEKLGFADYFLLVVELTNWCRKQEIAIGPGRGSVGGSLVAFCLGITDVDPIRFGLMFERFINPTRIDLPDIDLDFMSTRRHEIVEHLNDRYGADNVAGIINYSNLGSKSALRSTCRILGMEDTEYSCSKLIPSQFGFTTPLDEAKDKVSEVGKFAKEYPDVWNKALRLEGKLRNFSTHAAGIIVSNRPLINDAVIEVRGKEQSRIINWDKKLCEKQGLIKLDVLGLTTLDIIDLAKHYIKQRHGVTIDLHSIPLDDRAVLDLFSKGKTGGIFQFEGGSVRKLLKGLSRSFELTFDDLVAANALNRPGPIEAGLVQQYIDGKNGSIHDIPHKSMEDILEPTFNVMVYQEQIMKVSVEYAGYTMPESDNLRKIMGKKLPEEMKKEADKFVDGAVKKHGVERAEAQHIFDQISKFAMYAFNKSHSVEYSLLSYICMWLKRYYPVEYYAASLTYVDDKKVRSIINEAKKSGIDVLPPCINHSTDKFNPVNDFTITAPLNKIKYVAAVASLIMVEREANGKFTSTDNLIERTTLRAKRKAVNKRVVEAMEAIGALDDILPANTPPACPMARSRAINDYLPSIPLGNVFINREIKLTNDDKKQLGGLLFKLKDEDSRFVMPFVGNKMKFMVVFDSATKTDAQVGKFTEGKSFRSIANALYKADLEKAEGYWTSLIKRQKETKEKFFNQTLLNDSFNILKEEIAIIRPPAILCLGSQVAKMFDPSLKGGALDNAGKIIYDKDLDTNIIFGINPAQIFFNPEYEEILNELFETLGTMV